MVDTSQTPAFPSWAGFRKLPRGVPRKGRPRPLPALPCGTGAVTPRERAMTGGSSSRRRRAEERNSAAGTEHGSPREAAGGMGAGPALAALLLAGSVLSATLLAPGRRAEPGERAAARARGSGDRAWACPGPPHGLRGAGLERRAGSTLGWTAVPASQELRPGSVFPDSDVGPWGWVLYQSLNSPGERVKK